MVLYCHVAFDRPWPMAVGLLAMLSRHILSPDGTACSAALASMAPGWPLAMVLLREQMKKTRPDSIATWLSVLACLF